LARREGDDILDGGAGHDVIAIDINVISDTVEHDSIIGFNAAEDIIPTTLWWDDQGNAISTRAKVEQNGWTIYTTHDLEDGHLTHVLAIDAVGIPEEVFRNGFT
jgi:hypothetical protein